MASFRSTDSSWAVPWWNKHNRFTRPYTNWEDAVDIILCVAYFFNYVLFHVADFYFLLVLRTFLHNESSSGWCARIDINFLWLTFLFIFGLQHNRVLAVHSVCIGGLTRLKNSVGLDSETGREKLGGKGIAGNEIETIGQYAEAEPAKKVTAARKARRVGRHVRT